MKERRLNAECRRPPTSFFSRCTSPFEDSSFSWWDNETLYAESSRMAVGEESENRVNAAVCRNVLQKKEMAYMREAERGEVKCSRVMRLWKQAGVQKWWGKRGRKCKWEWGEKMRVVLWVSVYAVRWEERCRRGRQWVFKIEENTWDQAGHCTHHILIIMSALLPHKNRL